MKALLLVLAAAALVWAASAAGSPAPLHAPTGLHAFVYRASEPVKSDHTYAQLPAFTWSLVHGATRYEVELATSVTFTESTIIYDDKFVQTPVTSLQVQVPWMTGRPYAFYVRVRAVGGGRTSAWGHPFGFNTSWQQTPQQLQAPNGLVRWTPVDGATYYDVWFKESGTHVTTITNVADDREYWKGGVPSSPVVTWRVRAVRYIWGSTALPNNIVKISYGPYSKWFTSQNAPAAMNGLLTGTNAVSNVDSTPSKVRAHELTPGYTWNGSAGFDGQTANAWRVYVFSDRGCVNLVTTGTVVHGPAWAPRWLTKPIVPPKNTTAPATSSDAMADGTQVVPAENAAAATPPGATATTASSTSSSSSTAATGPQAGTLLALPDLGWPAGRYWWTIVPVRSGVDLDLPQDECAAGHVWSFGMQSMAVTAQRSTPLASGLQGTRVVSSASRQPAFEQLPVITWVPALGAQSYEIQLSRHLYPWRAAISQTSVVPSVTLHLTKHAVGRWYYRVRGVNALLPGSSIKMTWSRPATIQIRGDAFTILK